MLVDLCVLEVTCQLLDSLLVLLAFIVLLAKHLLQPIHLLDEAIQLLLVCLLGSLVLGILELLHLLQVMIVLAHQLLDVLAIELDLRH